jgi:hypothetical protein
MAFAFTISSNYCYYWIYEMFGLHDFIILKLEMRVTITSLVYISFKESAGEAIQ